MYIDVHMYICISTYSSRMCNNARYIYIYEITYIYTHIFMYKLYCHTFIATMTRGYKLAQLHRNHMQQGYKLAHVNSNHAAGLQARTCIFVARM